MQKYAPHIKICKIHRVFTQYASVHKTECDYQTAKNMHDFFVEICNISVKICRNMQNMLRLEKYATNSLNLVQNALRQP